MLSSCCLSVRDRLPTIHNSLVTALKVTMNISTSKSPWRKFVFVNLWRSKNYWRFTERWDSRDKWQNSSICKLFVWLINQPWHEQSQSRRHWTKLGGVPHIRNQHYYCLQLLSNRFLTTSAQLDKPWKRNRFRCIFPSRRCDDSLQFLFNRFLTTSVQPDKRREIDSVVYSFVVQIVTVF